MYQVHFPSLGSSAWWNIIYQPQYLIVYTTLTSGEDVFLIAKSSAFNIHAFHANHIIPGYLGPRICHKISIPQLINNNTNEVQIPDLTKPEKFSEPGSVLITSSQESHLAYRFTFEEIFSMASTITKEENIKKMKEWALIFEELRVAHAAKNFDAATSVTNKFENILTNHLNRAQQLLNTLEFSLGSSWLKLPLHDSSTTKLALTLLALLVACVAILVTVLIATLVYMTENK